MDDSVAPENNEKNKTYSGDAFVLGATYKEYREAVLFNFPNGFGGIDEKENTLTEKEGMLDEETGEKIIEQQVSRDLFVKMTDNSVRKSLEKYMDIWEIQRVRKIYCLDLEAEKKRCDKDTLPEHYVVLEENIAFLETEQGQYEEMLDALAYSIISICNVGKKACKNHSDANKYLVYSNGSFLVLEPVIEDNGGILLTSKRQPAEDSLRSMYS